MGVFSSVLSWRENRMGRNTGPCFYSPSLKSSGDCSGRCLESWVVPGQLGKRLLGVREKDVGGSAFSFSVVPEPE